MYFDVYNSICQNTKTKWSFLSIMSNLQPNCCLKVDFQNVDKHTRTPWHKSYFRIAGTLWGKSTGHRWIPITKGQWCAALMYALVSPWPTCWTNSRVNRRVNWDVLTIIWRHWNVYFIHILKTASVNCVIVIYVFRIRDQSLPDRTGPSISRRCIMPYD